MAKHALIPVDEFKMKELVGDAVSFFGAQTVTSTGSSKPKKEKKTPTDNDDK